MRICIRITIFAGVSGMQIQAAFEIRAGCQAAIVGKTMTMKDGRVLEHGPPRRVIREDSMRAIYRTPVRISDVDVGGGTASVCVPIRSPRPGASPE